MAYTLMTNSLKSFTKLTSGRMTLYATSVTANRSSTGSYLTYIPKAYLHLSPFPLKVTTFNLADIGEGITEVELLKWHKTIGDQIEEMDELCEVQSDKAAVEISSRYSGKILKFYKDIGDTVKIGSPLVDIETEGDDESVKVEEITPEPTFTPPSSATTPSQKTQKEEVKASPSTRRFAKEMNVDLSEVQGSGKDGRVEKSDVEKYMQQMSAPKQAAPQAASPTPSFTPTPEPTPTFTPIPITTSSSKENYDVPLKGFPKAMFKSMTETSKVPHLHVGEQINITNFLMMKNKMKEAAKKQYGMNITVTSMIIKAISSSLTKFPILNSKVDPSGEKYTIFGSHNISIAVDTPNGLVVPNIKNVQDLSIVQIQSELIRLTQLANNNKLSPSDLTGGTVSLSNVGVIGGTLVKALLFDGQAMIISVGRTQKLPRFDEKGNVVAHDIIEFGFSADHRHCDGATVARFSADLKATMETPEIMFMNYK